MPSNRFDSMTPTDEPIYNVWDSDNARADAWTYNRAAALRLARFAARKNGTTYHVAAHCEYLDRDGNIVTDFHSDRRIFTATPN